MTQKRTVEEIGKSHRAASVKWYEEWKEFEREVPAAIVNLPGFDWQRELARQIEEWGWVTPEGK